MESNRQLVTLIISVFFLIAMMVIMSYTLSEDQNPDLAGAEFLVS